MTQKTNERAQVAVDDRNIYQRLLAVMAGCNRVAKDGQVQGGGNYKFASHDAVTSEVRPHLIEHGVLVVPSLVERVQDGNRLEALYKVRFVNVDDPQDFVEVMALGYGIDTQDKGPGKAASYATKYALLKVLSLPTGDDPERDQIEHKPKGGANTAPRVPAAPKRKASARRDTEPEHGIGREDVVRVAKDKGVNLRDVRNHIADEWNATRVEDLTPHQRIALVEAIVEGRIAATQAGDAQ